MDSRDRFLDPIGWLREKIFESGLENIFKRYYGMYRGIVVDVKDPKKNGRVRIQVPALGHFKPADVPKNNWALPCMNVSVGDPDKTDKQVHGDFDPPELWDQVWVQFENGDSRYPVYMGGWIPDMEVKGKEEIYSEGNKVKVRRTRGGHQIRMSDKKDDVSVSIIKGNGKGEKEKISIIIDNGGKITMKSKEGFVSIEEDSIVVKTKSGAKVDLSGANVSIEDASGDKVLLESGNVKIIGKSQIKISAPIVDIDGSLVKIAKNAGQSAMTGEQFQTIFSTHTHPDKGLPPTPSPPITPGNGLSNRVKIG